ncbi:MAG: hypothetical protein H7Z41_01895 [Cytophagales bacterium]|nr:hypothetical protein [Armatimonadota bacterium]
MPAYQHFQQAKNAQPLPMSQQVGACITCSYWAVDAPRPEEEVEMVGLCVQPQLKDFALIVSGSSACNHWHEQLNAGPAAKAYAEAQA